MSRPAWWYAFWALYLAWFVWILVEDGSCHAYGHSFWPIDGSC